MGRHVGRIVDHRRRAGDFRSIAELKEVDGIGLKKPGTSDARSEPKGMKDGSHE
ncbi:MAG: hypothetical protein R3B96_15180 [Pirellulaceae bacterium]